MALASPKMEQLCTLTILRGSTVGLRQRGHLGPRLSPDPTAPGMAVWMQMLGCIIRSNCSCGSSTKLENVPVEEWCRRYIPLLAVYL